MSKDVIEVQVRAVFPLEEGSSAVFLGTPEKTFVIYVDGTVGTAISMFMRGVPKTRPLTHDLIGHLLLAFGAKVERVVINRIEGSVFHARLILSAENELLHTRKLVEIDARPSDSIALAIQASAPVFVAREVWDNVEDVSSTLAKIEEQGALQAADADESGTGGAEAGEEDDDDEEDEDESGLEDELFGDDTLFEDLEDDDDDDDEDDEEDEDDNPFTFGYDDDDDEGEEWKKG